MRLMNPLVVTAGLALAALLAACSGAATARDEYGTPSTTPTTSKALNLVVVGDSIAFGGHFCPGCNDFVAQYATIEQSRTGRKIKTENRSRDDTPGLPEIVTQVKTDKSLRHELAAADIVIVSVGGNNALPDLGNPPPGGLKPECDLVAPGFTDTIIGHIVATTLACNAKEVAAWAPSYDSIFGTIAGLRRNRLTVLIALNVHDGNLDNPDIKAAMDAATFMKTQEIIIDVYDKWNTMLCAQAKSHSFACVDLYHAFDGPRGNKKQPNLTVDGTHPSQAGHDVIAALLAKINPAAVFG